MEKVIISALLFIILNTTTAEFTQHVRFCYSKTGEDVIKDILHEDEWEEELNDLATNQEWGRINEKSMC